MKLTNVRLSQLMGNGIAFSFLFFFHNYGFGGTRSHASHAKNAVICSNRNRFLSVWILGKVLKFEDVDRTNIHADTVAVAFVPVNRNLWHFSSNLGLEIFQRRRDFKYFTLQAYFGVFLGLVLKRFITLL